VVIVVSIIQTDHLTKIFDDVHAVDAISFSVEKGEIFGFLGPNGAGKTTTIKMLTTLLRPTKGKAIIADADIKTQRNKVRKSIGVVFQEPALDIELTGQENLDYHARMYGIPRDLRKSRITEVLTLVDLLQKKDKLVKVYSGGMKRRLEIARGLMHRPKVLFLDEPTLGLDAQTRHAIWEYVKRLNKEEETTIFLTTHYMDEAEYLCDRVGIIDHGKIRVLDTIDHLKNVVGNDVITVSCSKQEVFQSHVQNISWVKNIKHHDSFLTIGVEKGEEKIPVLITMAQELGITVHSISVHKPTLDDVFLHFTGHRIRSQDENNVAATLPPQFRGRR